MKCFKKEVSLETKSCQEFYDITDSVSKVVGNSFIRDGLVHVFTLHTTMAVYVNEAEHFLYEDFLRHLNDFAPRIKGRYRHDNIAERDCPENEPENGHAHLMGALLGNNQVTVAVSEGKLYLGQWQRILLAEFDGPCPREGKSGRRRYLVHILGE